MAEYNLHSEEKAPSRSRAGMAALAFCGVAVGVGIGYVAFDSSSSSSVSTEENVSHLQSKLQTQVETDDEVLERLLASSASRMDLLEKLKKASNPKQAERDLAEEDLMEDFEIDPNNHRLYVTGQHRRPTDPATSAEVDAALNLLFSANGRINDREEAAEYFENWAPFNDNAEKMNKVFPTYIANSVNDRKYSPGEAEQLFLSTYDSLYAELGDAEAAMSGAYDALYADQEWVYSLTWGGISSTTTYVSSVDEVVEVEESIEDGIVDYELKRYMGVKVQGGITEVFENGDYWRSECLVVVDVSDINNPFVDGRYNEFYRVKRGNRFDTTPGSAPMGNADNAYLIAAARALYGGHQPVIGDTLSPVRWLPYYNGNPNNINGGVSSWSRNQRLFVKPFEWKDGDDAVMYGGEADPETGIQKERLMVAGLLQGSNSAMPVDAHAITGGVLLSSPPLSMVYVANKDRVDANNHLPNSEMIAMTWYGRGLDFSLSEAAEFAEAMDWAEIECSQFRQINIDIDGKSHEVLGEGTYGDMPSSCVDIHETTRFGILTRLVSNAINRAWGDDEIYGIQPGKLAPNEDGIMVPAITLKESFDEPTFANHATPSVVAEALSELGQKGTRDIRDNGIPNQTPPLNEDGTPKLAPNGKHLEYIGVDGPSFEIDGYAVTWDVGLKWKFQIGFSDDAGLTMYNIRLVMPPTQEYPEGEVVPYLFRANIPNFGTSYANTNVGGLHSALFLESHYGEHVGLVPGQNCRGLHMTLPIFRVRGITDVGDFGKTPIWYSMYGVPGAKPDPFAEAILGMTLPYNEFPLERGPVQNGIASHGVCIQETDEDHAMWHMYAAQRLRSLAVFGATISDAYNVVNRFEFLSDGKMKVAERLHGKPAIMGHGLGGAGGAYGSNGRGGFAANHLHWHVVALEPFVRKNIEGVTNRVRVSDMDPMNDDSNWFGLNFNRGHKDIINSSEEAEMRYEFKTQRHWEMEAFDKDGNDLGGLMLKSTAWGPPPGIQEGTDQAPFRYNDPDVTIPDEHTWKNHWWLGRNVWVRNADRTRATQTLLSSSKTAGCSIPYNTHDCQAEESIGDSPIVYAVMKVYHSVITEEMPIQNGFTSVELDIWPHNLLGFNPNILVRYMPKYNEYMQNPYVRGSDADPIYTAPYRSEWEELTECPGQSHSRCEALCIAAPKECKPTEHGSQFEGITEQWCSENCVTPDGEYAEACDPENTEPMCECFGDASEECLENCSKLCYPFSA